MRDEADALKRERMHLAGLIEEARSQAEQRRWVVWVGAGGIAIWSDRGFDRGGSRMSEVLLCAQVGLIDELQASE